MTGKLFLEKNHKKTTDFFNSWEICLPINVAILCEWRLMPRFNPFLFCGISSVIINNELLHFVKLFNVLKIFTTDFKRCFFMICITYWCYLTSLLPTVILSMMNWRNVTFTELLTQWYLLNFFARTTCWPPFPWKMNTFIWLDAYCCYFCTSITSNTVIIIFFKSCLFIHEVQHWLSDHNVKYFTFLAMYLGCHMESICKLLYYQVHQTLILLHGLTPLVKNLMLFWSFIV